MTDVYIVVFSLLGILISLPGLVVALNLLLPRVTANAATRLARTPGKSFVLGVPVVASFLLWIAITSQINFGPIRATSFLATFAGMGLGTVGAAGLARLLGERLRPMAGPTSELGALVRGAVVYELACLVPIVGWFLFIPLVGTAVMGAAVFGLLGWIPRPKVASAAAPVVLVSES
ncbi:MAG: hypothetical protein L0332_10995 [Chloroflexi bacterium]|nr:hypothetical protein [Chloroflexota bacterium]MCI0648765.1 hypothetical protein [Chloroflexota bacterium]MCI0727233.1 hypothetical protein [Chloroflexota bacterium]